MHVYDYSGLLPNVYNLSWPLLDHVVPLTVPIMPLAVPIMPQD